MGSTSTLVILSMLLLNYISSTAALPSSPLIGINAGCSTESIERFCKPEHLFCIRSACSQCILRDPFNQFASFCARLTSCVCKISNDEDCEAKIEKTCY